MEAKRIVFACCTLAFLQTSFAGFWPFSSQDAHSMSEDGWNELNPQQQDVLLQHYQNLKEIPESQRMTLKQRMDWFTQLSEADQQKMRDAWQKMNTEQRKKLRKLMDQAETKVERDQIRNEYIQKYLPNDQAETPPAS